MCAKRWKKVKNCCPRETENLQFEGVGHWNGFYVRVLGVWDGSELLCMSAAAVNFPTGEVRGRPAVIRAVKGARSGLSHTFCRVYWSFGGNSCG